MDAPGTAAGAGGGVPGRRALLAAATVDAPFPSAEHIATESVVPKAKGPGCVDTLDLHRRHLSGVCAAGQCLGNPLPRILQHGSALRSEIHCACRGSVGQE
jgi:hypothetical protein